jgi:hypothetical protein
MFAEAQFVFRRRDTFLCSAFAGLPLDRNVFEFYDWSRQGMQRKLCRKIRREKLLKKSSGRQEDNMEDDFNSILKKSDFLNVFHLRFNGGIFLTRK